MSENEKATQAQLLAMAHDIKTPISAIMGYAKLMESNLDNKDKLSDYLAKIQMSGNMLLELVNSMLIGNGQVICVSPCCIKDFEGTVLSMFAEKARVKNIDLQVTVNCSNQYVMADRIKVQEILLNLVSNALKYTENGGSVSVNINETSCEKECRAAYEIAVSDTGIGMNEEFLPHVFEEFTRDDNYDAAAVEGHGYGMSIVKKYVDMMGGSIKVDSRLNQGTTFTVTLIFGIAGEPEKKQESEPAGASARRILLAEDDEQNAEIAMELLEYSGYGVERAADGQSLVDMLEGSEAGYYDLVITDINMPELNGYQAVKVIRQMEDASKAAIPVIAMSANAFEKDKENALAAGMNGLIAKPIDIRKLEIMLDNILK